MQNRVCENWTRSQRRQREEEVVEEACVREAHGSGTNTDRTVKNKDVARTEAQGHERLGDPPVYLE